MKKTIAILLTMILAFSFMTNIIFAEDKIKVIMDGKTLTFDQEPIIRNNRTMVPMRAIFDEFDAEVNWDSKIRTVIAQKGSLSVVLTVDTPYAYINTVKKDLDSPAIIEGNRTLVPLRFISEALNAKVEWSSSTRTVTISTDDYVTPSPSTETTTTASPSASTSATPATSATTSVTPSTSTTTSTVPSTSASTSVTPSTSASTSAAPSTSTSTSAEPSTSATTSTAPSTSTSVEPSTSTSTSPAPATTSTETPTSATN